MRIDNASVEADRDKLGQRRQQAAGDPPAATGDELVSPRLLAWGTILLFAYFGLRLLFFALKISPAVPPDEVTHAGLCKVFSRALLLPSNSPETYQYGLVTNIPWLYYWIMGKLLHLNIFGIPDLVFLRLLNIPLGLGTAWYSLKLLGLFTESRLARLLLLVAMTNTAMFSLQSASVSYDNLTNLLAVMAIYYQFAFFRERTGGNLLASLLCQAAASLTKVTFLPLVPALNVLLIVHERQNLRTIPSLIAGYFRNSPRRASASAALLAVAAGLCIQLYGGNYLRYGSVNPDMTTVLSSSAAMQYRLEARGMIFKQYRDGKISYMDAVIMAGEITHPGDKADTFYLLMNYENLKRNPQLWMGPLEYAQYWYENMLATMFGIKAHLGMYKDFPYMVPLYLLPAIAVVGFVVRWRPRESGWLPLSLAAVAVWYAGYLMVAVNYDTYLAYGAPGLTVYGRYLFPVIGAIYVFVCRYLLDLFRGERIRCGVALATALLLIWYDFPWFLANATPEWFAWLPQ